MTFPSDKAGMRGAPLACFDTLDTLNDWASPEGLSSPQANDFAMAMRFLKQYVGSTGTFNAYRREVEHLLQWSWHIAFKTFDALKPDDIEAFIRF